MPSILETTTIGGDSYKNPAPAGFDPASQTWAKDVCSGQTWLANDPPRYEWTPVLNPSNETEDRENGLSGTALLPHDSTADFWFSHPFGYDWNVDVAVDAEYSSLMSPILKDDPERDEAIQRAKNLGISVSNVLHVEMDSEFIPEQYRAQEGDRVVIYGRWIVDCGHDDFGAEIHPPLIFVAARPDSQDSDLTHSTVIGRPFLVSKSLEMEISVLT
jgi:hypothetical protein